MAKGFYITISIILAVIIVINSFLFIAGSLETYPTAEQIEKGRIVYGLLFVPLVIIESFIVTRFFKKE